MLFVLGKLHLHEHSPKMQLVNVTQLSSLGYKLINDLLAWRVKIKVNA